MKIKLDDSAIMPTRAHKTDAGLDLYTPVGFNLDPYSCKTIDTGVHVELPPGTVGLLKSKSGLWIKKGITSGEGVVNEGYTGSIKVKVFNHSHDYQYIARGDKISQLLIIPCLAPDLELADKLDETERGENGFGSTGSSVYDDVRMNPKKADDIDGFIRDLKILKEIDDIFQKTMDILESKLEQKERDVCDNCKYFNGDIEFGRFGRCVKRSKTVWGGAACECFEQGRQK